VGEVVVMRQGEIWYGESPSRKGRPYLVLTRNQAIGLLNTVLVAPITRTIRGIPTEVVLGTDDGLNQQCVASIDNALAFRRAYLTEHLGAVDAHRWHEVCAAMRAAIDC
jgi:mRNA interferase MazF